MPHFNILRDHTEIVEFIILKVHDSKCAFVCNKHSKRIKFNEIWWWISTFRLFFCSISAYLFLLIELRTSVKSPSSNSDVHQNDDAINVHHIYSLRNNITNVHLMVKGKICVPAHLLSDISSSDLLCGVICVLYTL